MSSNATNLTAGDAGSGASSYATASITPSANALVLAYIHSFGSGGPGNTPTATGCGLTWVVVASFVPSGNNRVTLFRAMGSPTSGAVTFDFAGQNQSIPCWTISQFTGVDQTGTNGSGAVVQSVTGTAFTNNLVITLAAFGNAANAGYGAFNISAVATISPGSGFTQLGEAGTGFTVMDEWEINNTSVNATTAVNHGFDGMTGRILLLCVSSLLRTRRIQTIPNYIL